MSARPYGIEIGYVGSGEALEPRDAVRRRNGSPVLQTPPLSGHGAGELQNLSILAAPPREGHAEPASEPLPPGIVRPRGLEHPPAFKGVIQAAGLCRALETEAEKLEVEVGGRSYVEGSFSFLLTIPERFRLSTPREKMPCLVSIG
jgi:hypothetical protein